ncbi:FAD-binding oxidoreductase [Mycobacterium sp. pW049]|uniref:FAD-binding oxidoreductase n=1 Tax=[Mycobacterium] bulgaricum TaxID=3238985 RepID=UPI00351BE75E
MTIDVDAMTAYRRDQSALTAAGYPAALVRARNTDDVVATLKYAHAHKIPLVTRGAGTGLAGAANAIDGAIVLSMERMNRILDVDAGRRIARVQPGVINADLAAAAAEHGLWYVPDPGSREISTIGGNIATNAGGACCAKYGVTADHVAALTAVLADGRIIHTGAVTRKNAAGLNLTQLIVGSEGALAVIVEATLRLRRSSADPATVVASFPSVGQAISAVLGIRDATEPCVAELMDQTTIAAVNAMTQMGLDATAGALLLVQYDDRTSEAQASACAGLCSQHGATEVYHTSDPIEGEQFMQARRVAFTALEKQGSALLDDLAVPVPALPEMLSAIESIAAKHDLTIGTFGHAADGNLHPTIIFNAGDADETGRARDAFDAMVNACLDLGGSITGEHGVGVLKHRYLQRMIGPIECELSAKVKAAFDPHGILNPGRSL